MGGTNSNMDATEGTEEPGSEGAAAPSNENGDKTSETASQDSKIQIEDVSEYVRDSEEDDGTKRYRITLLLEEEVRLQPGVEPKVTINDKKVLKVKVGNRLYHRVKLQEDATIKQPLDFSAKKITVLLNKTVHKKWKR